jgi:hypothetical protein
MYAIILKKLKKTDFLPRFFVISTMPFFGILIMLIVDITAREKSYKVHELIFEDEQEFKNRECFISDQLNDNFLEALPFYNALDIKDIQKKRKRIFNIIEGNNNEIYPFLLKALKGGDAEVVHYASAAITNYRQKVNEKFGLMKEKFKTNPNDKNILKDYLDTFLDLICFEEANGMEATEERKSFGKILDIFFETNDFIEEKYFIQKIKNEIILKKFDDAFKTCNKFLEKYPESDNAYLALLKLWYYGKNSKMFVKTLQDIISKDFSLTRETTGIIAFWRGHILIDSGRLVL